MGWKTSPVKFIKAVVDTHKKNTAEIESFLYRQIKFYSPVHTGAYKTNHNRTKNKPSFFFDARLTSGQQPQPAFAAFDSLHISNGAPYAGVIEYGRAGYRYVPRKVYGRALNDTKARFKL